MTDWTPEEDKVLVELWEQGLSGGRIGDRLGRSKNSVVGRAHRLKLPGRASPITEGKSSAERARAAVAHRRAGVGKRGRLQAAAQANRLARRDTLPAGAEPEREVPSSVEPYAPRTCQFIEGEPTANDSCKCGAEVKPGSSYCTEHHARCYTRRAAPSTLPLWLGPRSRKQVKSRVEARRWW